MLNDEQGSALVYTLLVLMVLSILGISVGMVTVGSYRLAHENQESTSAYYIAEAGATLTYEKIASLIPGIYEASTTESSFKNSVNSLIKNLDTGFSDEFSSQNGKLPNAKVVVVPSGNMVYTILSTGEVSGNKRVVEKKVQVNWIEKNTELFFPELPDKAALIVNNGVKISGNELSGNLLLNTTVPKSISIGEIKIQDSAIFYPSEARYSDLLTNLSSINKFNSHGMMREKIDFKVYEELFSHFSVPKIENRLKLKSIKQDNNTHNVIDDKGNLMVTHYLAKDYVVKLDRDVYIPKIESNSNRGFSFDTGGGDYTLLVDVMDVKSEYIDILGGGELTIIVKNKMNVSSMGPFNGKGKSSQLAIIYLGNENVQFSQWGSKVNGHIIAPNANFIGQNVEINGVVLIGGNEITLSGGNANSNMLLIAPKAKVNLSGSYSINGNVIASSYEMSGGTKLNYKKIDTEGFPLLRESAPEKPNIKEIIFDGPIVEPN